MSEALDEMGRQPKVVGTELPVIFPLAQSRVSKGLAVGVDQFVLLQFLVQPEGVQQSYGVLQPKRVVGNGLYFIRGFQNPAFAPSVDDRVLLRRSGHEVQGYFENYGIDVFACLAVDARVDKAVITTLVSSKPITVPRQRACRQILLDPVIAPFREVWIVVEQIIAFQFEKCLGNFEFASVRHGMRHVVELRGVVDGPEKTRQIIEEGIVAATDERLNCKMVRCFDCRGLVSSNDGGKAAAGEVDKSHGGATRRVDGNPDFRRAKRA